MSKVLILVRKSLLMFSRARAAVVITFAVPIVLIFLFGHVFGLFGSSGDAGPKGIRIVVVNDSHEPAAQQLIDALRAEKTFYVVTTTKGPDGVAQPLTEPAVRAGLHNNDYRYALILPADLLSDERIGVRLKFLWNPRNEIEAQTVNGMLQKTIFAKVPQLLGQSLQRHSRNLLGDETFHRFNRSVASAVSSAFGGDRDEIQQQIESGDLFRAPARREPQLEPGLRRLDATASTTTGGQAAAAKPAPAEQDRPDLFSSIVKLETEQVAGKEVKNPMAARMVGGYAIMFLLFAVSGSASTLFEERSSGVFQRLLSSPVRPAHIIWARFLFGVILGMVQITAMFVAGHLFFGIEIVQHLAPLLAISLSAAAACSAFGILVAALAPSAAAASGLATFVVISMSAVGGAWFPVSFMPPYIQTFSKLTLVYWSVEGFIDALWAGRSLFEVLPTVGILTAIAAVVMAVSTWRFGRTKFFEG